MRKYLFLLMLMMGMVNLSFASFPVSDKAVEQTELSTEIPEPVIEQAFNWQAFASAGCVLLGFLVSWPFLIAGVAFGVMGVMGDKNLKWLAWIELFANALWLLLVLAAL